ncbi:hypothetical protein PHAMO_80046 [Magnetospirillum molischianum DSM 120]|uniref:Uncharacterized protein n=1 Tax=Magnetospirillum molischianum DSM 120 TaxID=1150626 RepID=H8FY17_MAGML|nr:hypothetical protein PHAMO_80046 [Magnetospirillum molischianum DSM 120]
MSLSSSLSHFASLETVAHGSFITPSFEGRNTLFYVPSFFCALAFKERERNPLYKRGRRDKPKFSLVFKDDQKNQSALIFLLRRTFGTLL